MQRRWLESDSAWLREELSRFQTAAPCDSCDGHRLKPESRAVKIDGLHIGQVTEKSIAAAVEWFETLEDRLTQKQREIAVRVLREIRDRLKFLNNVGLAYLTLAWASGTLSGGEAQRTLLSSQIGAGLPGWVYCLA